MSEYKVAILAKGASPDLSEKARKMAAEINANPAEFTKKMAVFINDNRSLQIKASSDGKKLTLISSALHADAGESDASSELQTYTSDSNNMAYDLLIKVVGDLISSAIKAALSYAWNRYCPNQGNAEQTGIGQLLLPISNNQ
jgi:hypothetical protein